MAFFKSEEEKLAEEKQQLKKYEDEIFKRKIYRGKVGHIHQGLSYAGVWGVRDNGKMKFYSTTFNIHDTKLMIERNKMIIEFTNIKEIFEDGENEAIIILNDNSGIPIKTLSTGTSSRLRFKSFINILNRLIKENTTNISSMKGKSEDTVDKMLKLGEMYNNGLLSDEEFILMKQKLIEGTSEDINTDENDIEPSNICKNCGTDISPEDAYCGECGTKIN
ncbi:zinc-ribbon domain-containing protein [Methanobrevibacter sp.]|uniref:zinc-ribbon domain-containing protein n=1 Tax=Methanobrevibacter sp. TaxID=66852 RepID=UPI00388E6C58